MIESIFLGAGFAFASAIQPGPLQAFLIARVAATGWRRTLPACLAPLLTDGPIAILVLLVLGRLSVTARSLLRASGGGLLLYLAWVAYRQWRSPDAPGAGGSAPRTFLQAALVNALNPNPYLGWALVLGPSALAAWRDHPWSAVALVAAFYGTMVAMLALFVLLVGTVRFLGSRGQRALLAVSALALAMLGAWLLVTGARTIGAV